MLIHYKYLKNNTVLAQQYCENFDAQKIIDFFAELYADERYLSVEYIISDFRSTVVTGTDKEVLDLVKFIINNAPKAKFVRNAILVTEPMQTAFSYLYQLAMQDMTRYECSVVCSYSAISAYTGLNRKEIEDMLQNISEK